MRLTAEVCVLGAGPAGASVAARLADKGIDAVVLDRPRKVKPWGGESLAGAVAAPLTVLGMWEAFAAAGHVRGYEQQTNWGGQIRDQSGMANPYGGLWHVDRARFDQDLRTAVERRGGQVHAYQELNEIRRQGGMWRLSLDRSHIVSARYLVDATGRARAVLKRLGIHPRLYDRLIALTAIVPRSHRSGLQHTMVIETTPFGWWYAAPVPQGHALVLLTDPDLAPAELRRSMRSVPAHSSFASPRGDGWLAVGDACAAHDPLCGWGVCRAIENAILAADAIHCDLACGDASLATEYERHCRDQFRDYLTGLAEHYSLEQRWQSASFWQRRRSIPLTRAW